MPVYYSFREPQTPTILHALSVRECLLYSLARALAVDLSSSQTIEQLVDGLLKLLPLCPVLEWIGMRRNQRVDMDGATYIATLRKLFTATTSLEVIYVEQLRNPRYFEVLRNSEQIMFPQSSAFVDTQPYPYGLVYE